MSRLEGVEEVSPWRARVLQLNFWFGVDYRVFLFSTIIFPLLAFVITCELEIVALTPVK